MRYVHFLLLLIILVGCKEQQANSNSTTTSPYTNESFPAYWDKGLAEMNSYDLVQSRYGEQRKGSAVLIFVTEDFSTSKQVKLDNPGDAKADAAHVLKLNFTKKFNTGVYPYSMMMSVFTTLDNNSHPLKVTTSSQEWCGHTFTQLNYKNGSYNAQLYSYFETEGDALHTIEGDALLEDGVWNTIRTNPDELPIGEVTMLPGTLYQRLSHSALKAVKTDCSLNIVANDEYTLCTDTEINRYTIHYPETDRTLTIDFGKDFPYTIWGFSETYTNIMNGEIAETKAILKKQLMLDYWKHHGLADSIYRDSLMLSR